MSLARIREKIQVPCIEDDLLMFEDVTKIPFPNEARKMNSLIIGVCTDGEGSFTLNQTEYKVNRNDVFVLTDGMIVENIRMSANAKGFAVLVSNRFTQDVVKDVHNLTDLFMLTHRYPVFSMTEEEMNTTKEYISMITKRMMGKDYRFRKDVVRLLLLTLIYDLSNVFDRVLNMETTTSSNSKPERAFMQFIQLVEQNYRRERRVSWYAEQMGISPKYLSEVISNVSKRTPNDWINKYVTTELRNLLRTTDMRIQEIAEAMNFPNQSFLGKYFKENVGVSPLKYRKGK